MAIKLGSKDDERKKEREAKEQREERSKENVSKNEKRWCK